MVLEYVDTSTVDTIQFSSGLSGVVSPGLCNSATDGGREGRNGSLPAMEPHPQGHTFFGGIIGAPPTNPGGRGGKSL